MRQHELFAGQLVEPAAHPLREASRVDEDQGGPMRPDELEQGGIDVGPDGVALLRPGILICALGQVGEVLDRHDHLEVERLPRSCVGDRHVAANATKEGGDGRERSLRRRQPDPLRLDVGQRAEPLERDGQMRAALRAGHGVDLVDDHVFDPAQRLAGLAGQEQVERLGRGDEDLGRVARQLPARVGGSVAGARGDTHLGQLQCQPLRGAANAGEGSSQVALHVVGERLERRDVEDAQPPLARPRRGVREEPVEAPQKGSQGLAAPGRRMEQRVPPRGDRCPAENLSTGRGGERLAEPGARGSGEGGQRIRLGHDRLSLARPSQVEQMFYCVALGPGSLGAQSRVRRDGHQFQRPRRTTRDGTSSDRSRKVSIRTPAATP